MATQQTVLLVGGTGRTGQQTLQQLLARGINVRAIVRTPEKLPPEITDHPNLRIIKASLLSLRDEELRQHLSGCCSVISCLGHNISLKGIFGPPRDLVTKATMRLCRGIQSLEPKQNVKFILMSSVSVHRSRALDTRRGSFERAFLWMLCNVLPPAKDNQKAADFLLKKIGSNNPHIQWVAIRPDTLIEEDVSKYTMHDGLVNSLFAPGNTNIANVAHFMCELVVNPKTWADWKNKLPVLLNIS